MNCLKGPMFGMVNKVARNHHKVYHKLVDLGKMLITTPEDFIVD